MPQQNPQNQPKFRATAREFCPPVRQEAGRTQDREEVQDKPELVEKMPDEVEEMDDGNIGEKEDMRRSQRRGRPTERFTYDTLGQPSYRH